MRGLIAPLAAVAIAFLMALVVVTMAGQQPAEVARIILRGSIGSLAAILETLRKSIPLLFTALAVVVAFRAGVWNIGGEGQFIVGGLAATSVALAFPRGVLGTAGALLAAAAAGAAWSGIPAIMRLRRQTPEVLSTILLNFVAIYLLGYLVSGPMQEKGSQYPQTDGLPEASVLPLIAGRLHSGVFIALMAAFAVYWLMFRTREGLFLRAVGLNPRAAEFAGIEVRWRIARATLISGALAGLGGGVELLGVTHRMFERFASGYGYAGIAVALLGQLHPIGSIASALFFGSLATGSGELQRSMGLSSAIALLVQAMVVLILLLFSSKRIRAVLEGRARGHA